LLRDPAWRGVVATRSGRLVGAALATDDGAEAGFARVEVLYVLPGERRAGIGRRLLADVVAWATARGREGLDVVTAPGDRASKAFLEAAGLKARLIVMHRPLP
jgi:GNAT superfamily N-acetyltransferase